MNKDTIKFFLSWLETARYNELIERRGTIGEILEMAQQPKSGYRVSDIKFLLRLIDEEISNRLLVDQLKNGNYDD